MMILVKKWGWITVVVLLLSLVMAQIYLAGLRYEKLEYLRVVDGDTFWVVNKRDGSEWKVRLRGVDAPDTKECYFKEASEILNKELVEKQIVYERFGYDSYGRILAKVFADGKNIEEILVAKGAAVAYDATNVHDKLKPSKEYFESLKIIEEKAKKEKQGMWGSACVRI